MTFKAGDKVYFYSYGVAELRTNEDPDYPLKVWANGTTTLTQCGRRYSDDKYPSIIPLEEAEKRGFVRKEVVIRGLRVKYWDTRFPFYSATCRCYESREDFEQRADLDCKFISFVDEKLNECDPPKETVEWEEIV